MSLEFHFNSTVTSEPSHIDKQYPVFLSPHTQVICLSFPRLRFVLWSRNVSVMLIVMLSVTVYIHTALMDIATYRHQLYYQRSVQDKGPASRCGRLTPVLTE